MSDINKIFHDIRSKCSSIKSAVDLIKTADEAEKKEIISLMEKAAMDLTKAIKELKKPSD